MKKRIVSVLLLVVLLIPLVAVGDASASYYAPLRKGDQGDSVFDLQMRLMMLGYSLEDGADGKYGDRTAEAVYVFKLTNGLDTYYEPYVADSNMQSCLFSDSAMYAIEPDFALIIPNESYGTWKKLSGDKLQMNITVHNISRLKFIKAFELYIYATDVWGEPIYGEDWVYYETTKKDIAPGQSVKSVDFVIPNRSEIETVYCAINKIVYADGTVKEAERPLNYANWLIRW